MKSYRSLLVLAVVAAFIAVPFLSAAAEADPSWENGESASYYKVSDINDKEQLDKLVDISKIQENIIGSDLVFNAEDLTVKSVSGITVETGSMKKVTNDESTTESFYKISGTVIYDAKTMSNPLLQKMSLTKGELYDKINETVPSYMSHEPMSIKCTFEIKYCLVEYGKYSEANDSYVLTEKKTDCQTYSSTSDVEITVNGTTVSYELNFVQESVRNDKFTFSEAISKDKDAPATCDDEISTTVYGCGTKITGTVDGKSYEQYNDKDAKELEIKKSDGKHTNVLTEGTTSMSSNVDFTDITNGFLSSDDAKTYITDTLHGETLDTYSEVAKKAKNFERSESKSDSGNSDNTIWIVVGVIIAVIVIAAIAYILYKKKKA